ncbi:MAG: hypothetical protein IJV43_07700 [Oscillospiraceae bacterium]|nr:hypothetical protein [Oscillospiraceae bacterium]
MSKNAKMGKVSKEKLLRIIDRVVMIAFFLIAPISVAAYFASGTLRAHLLMLVVYIVPTCAVLEIIEIVIKNMIKNEDKERSE